MKQGAVRSARAKFVSASSAEKVLEKSPDWRVETPEGVAYRLDGIDVDGAYRTACADGSVNARIVDIAFPHTTGLRPYCYGLQACNHTAGAMVEAWIVEGESGTVPASNAAALTRLHDKVADEP